MIRVTRSTPHFRRRLARWLAFASLALAVLSAALWAASGVFGSVGIYSIGDGTSLRFARGSIQVHHFYDCDIAPPVPQDRWHTTAISRGWVVPVDGPRWTLPMFAFSGGNVSGIAARDGLVSPARYWLLRVPLWALMLPGFFAAAWLAVTWDPARQDRRRGFDVAAADSGCRQRQPVQ